MDATIIIAIVAAVIIIALVVIWILTANSAKSRFNLDLQHKEETLQQLTAQLTESRTELAGKVSALSEMATTLSEKEADLIRKEAQVHTAETLRASEKEQYEKALNEIKAGNEKAIEAAKTALALENEKILKAREEALKKEAAETMKAITGGLDQNIKDMKAAFEAQKETQAKESATIQKQFEETVKHLREQTESIGNQAEDLAKALKGQNKIQGNFGETILENMFKDQGMREGHDYESEYWLRDKDGNLIRNEDTGKKMRPDFVLHFPDDTVVLIDSKMSLTALTDYYAAETDEAREDAAERNLASVKDHVKELISKEYQKYVQTYKTLDYVIMFIPNYGAFQLAKMKDPGIFSWAFERNVLITTEETLIPFLRLIRSAWVQKEQMENISEIVKAAQNMVDRVAIFCDENAKIKKSLESVLEEFNKNSARLVDSKQSIVKAAWQAVEHGIELPTKHTLPALGPSLLMEGESPAESN